MNLAFNKKLIHCVKNDFAGMHLIKVGMARQYVQNLGEEVKKGLRQKAKAKTMDTINTNG